jgi:hypothetical protein
MIWIVFAELLPEALEDAPHGTIATAATLSAAWLEALRMALARLEQPNGSLASPVAGDLAIVVPTIAMFLPAVLPACAAGEAGWAGTDRRARLAPLLAPAYTIQKAWMHAGCAGALRSHSVAMELHEMGALDGCHCASATAARILCVVAARRVGAGELGWKGGQGRAKKRGACM